MPQTRSDDSSSSPRPKAKPGGAAAKRSTGSSSARTTRAAGAKSARTPPAESTSHARSAAPKPSAGPHDARLEAAAQRLRKLNERIIEAGKDAGESTLSSYEKALKSMASALERGAGSNEIDWISNLATTQAKFMRDVTEAWTSAARKMLE
jgi:hypothetical protein